MRLTADFMPRECQKEAPSSNTADRLDDRSQLLPRKNQTNNDPKNVKKSSQIWLKIVEKRVRRHPRAPKSTDEVKDPFFFRFFRAPGRYRDYDLDPFSTRNSVFLPCKKLSKNGHLQNLLFPLLLAISGASGARFSSILGPKSDPRRSFSRRFSGDWFYTWFFVYFLEKRLFSETLKTLQSTAPASKIKGHRFEKKPCCVKRTHRKKTSNFHRFLTPKRPKNA